jgi:hypothetical protein
VADESPLDAVAEELALVLLPLEEAATDLDAFQKLMLQLGFEPGSIPADFSALANAVDDLGTDAQKLAAGTGDALTVLDDVSTIFSGITGLGQAPPGVNATEYAAEVPLRLFDFLLLEYLRAYRPRIYTVLQLLDIARVEEVAATTTRPAYARQRLRPRQITKVLSDPGSLPEWIYGWGSDDFDFLRLLDNLADLSRAFKLPVYIDPVEDELATAFKQAAASQAAPDWRLVIPFAHPMFAGTIYEVGLEVLELPKDGGKKPGIVIQPATPQQIGAELELSESATLTIRAGTDIAQQLGLLIRPGEIAVKYPFQPGAALPSAGFGASIDFSPDEPKTLIGTSDGTRLELAGGAAGFFIETAAGQFEVRLDAEVRDLTAVLTAGDQDGFLGKILAGAEIVVPMELGLRWSSRTGFQFVGGAGFNVTLSPHLELGPITIQKIDLGLRTKLDTTKPPQLSTQVGLSLGGALGPFSFSVERIGVSVDFVFEQGNAGPFDIEVGFLPPKGLGMAVDATVVKGGGYLYFDFEAGEYAGVLELGIQNIVQVKAIGILNTKMPDGRPGFSLLLIITAEFPPIQLSFGFTLNGVGGLIGVNRTTVTDVIRAGLRTHTLDSILFPKNPVQRAPQIISDLKAVFPVSEGRFVFGPMVMIGWGSPSIIKASLGVLIEVPSPIRIIILGQISAVLPDEKAAVVKLHLDCLGIVDFEKSTFSLDASIYDSTIVAFQLYGDMAMRLNWGERPNFALSVGGLHPRYQPPPGFPELRRLGLSMGFGDYVRLSLETYMALTANSVQFGARLEAKVEGGGFLLRGYLAFDTLFYFSPFSMIAEMSAGVDVLRGNTVLLTVHLEFTLSGPSPWHAFGNASFKVLFFTVTVAFDKTFGEQVPEELPVADVKAPLLTALADPANWSADPPPGGEQAASLQSKPVLPAGTILVHPFGRLTVRQKIVPLGETITKVGNARPSGPTRFEITGAKLNQQSAGRDDVMDHFARGQFFEMTDDEKVTKESYELMRAGAALGSSDAEAGNRSRVEVHYDTYVVDDPVRPERKTARYKLRPELFDAQIRQGAAEMSQILNSGAAKFAQPGAESAISMSEVEFVIAGTDDLTVREDLSVDGGGRAAAEHALARHLEKNPDEDGALQVVPAYEAVGA